MEKGITIALAGNPNCGKTTLFNALTGSNQFVGNWPGVTVEKKEGKLKGHEDITVTDLPGIYSLSPYTLEEVVARNYLLDEHPDVILDIVDGTNLERNLYLTSQLKEIGIPVVVAVNMLDVLRKKGDVLNLEALSKDLKCEVVEISALKEIGIDEAAEKAIEAALAPRKHTPMHWFSGPVEHAIAHIEEAAIHDMDEEKQRWYAVKIFERDEKVIEKLSIDRATVSHIEEDIEECEDELDDDAESIIANERYNYVTSIVRDCYHKKGKGGLTTSDKIDRVVTNRYAALPIFAVVIFLVYYISVSLVGSWASGWMNNGVFGEGWHLFGTDVWVPGIPVVIGDLLNASGCAGWLSSLVLEGIVAGVGAVLGFVPQIFCLFLFLSFLESCGYMARIAFVLDRIFRKFGLSGKSFIPMLIGTGCGVPGIMASRTIENDRDRKITIITTTFIPCGAKLPIIAMIAGAMFNGEWWVAPSAYFVGIAAIITSGIILKKTKLFRGEIAPFVMELPAYHMPLVKNVLKATWDRGWSFIKKAGTIILIATIVIWFLSNFGFEEGRFGMVDMDSSILAFVGSCVAWLFIPLGWGHWEFAVSALSGLLAKENVVSTFGVLFGGNDGTGSMYDVWASLRAMISPVASYSFLIFNLLCAPCLAAVATIRNEMNSTKWMLFAVGYQCVFAYAVSLMIYQMGSFAAGEGSVLGLCAAVAAAVCFLYMLFRPVKHERRRLS